MVKENLIYGLWLVSHGSSSYSLSVARRYSYSLTAGLESLAQEAEIQQKFIDLI